jgi:hypothetical protein
MPRCIFCDRDVPHVIAKDRPERSLCLDCLIEMKRFETQNMEEIMRRLFPKDVVDAMRRLKGMDTSQALNQQQQSQMLRDLQSAQQVLRF